MTLLFSVIRIHHGPSPYNALPNLLIHSLPYYLPNCGLPKIALFFLIKLLLHNYNYQSEGCCYCNETCDLSLFNLAKLATIFL